MRLLSIVAGLGLHYAASAAQEDPEELCANSGTLAPPQNNLTGIRTATLNVSGSPAGLAYAPAYGNIAFAALSDPSLITNSSIGVIDTSNFEPKLKHQVFLPKAATEGLGVFGLALSADQRHLITVGGYGGYILDAARTASGKEDALVGSLNGTTTSQHPGTGAFGVSISPDAKYAFIAQEYGVNETTQIGNVDVFSLRYQYGGTAVATPIGFLNLDQLVTSVVLSPDGKLAYATSEQKAPGVFYGTLSVVNVTTLETTPSNALVSQARAGCGTVRAIVSRDGAVVWTTSRQDNSLLAFDAAKLVSEPSKALLANITVGTSPVGLTFAKNESRIITGDSNRFAIAGATASLTLVDVHAALAGKKQKSVLGRIPTGLFPREFAESPDGRQILVSDFDSQQVQLVDVTSLP